MGQQTIDSVHRLIQKGQEQEVVCCLSYVCTFSQMLAHDVCFELPRRQLLSLLVAV